MLTYFREKRFDTWIEGYARHTIANRRPSRVAGPRHLLFALCDHWEPLWNQVGGAQADARVRFWVEEYPRLAAEFRDADGRSPRHSFFFPGEQYRPAWLEALAGLARRGIAEVEVHLHHDGDTAETLRSDLLTTLDHFAGHGHLSRGPAGEKRYAFIHGNWCLANARADGTYCGVDAEIPLLFETGCYADFTFPAAPDESQPNIVNRDLLADRGPRAEARLRGGRARARGRGAEGPHPDDRGPARARDAGGEDPAPHRERGRHGQGARHAEAHRDVGPAEHPRRGPARVGLRQGAHPRRAGASGGLPARRRGARMHRALTTRYNDGREWVLHYVTAREMFNIAVAAMEGEGGDPSAYRDYVLPPPPVAG